MPPEREVGAASPTPVMGYLPPGLSQHHPSAALETLFTVGRILASTLDFTDLLERLMTLSMETIGSETASVMLSDPETGELVLVCSRGLPEGVKAGTRPASSGGGIAEWVYRQGEPVLLHGHPSDDPRFRSAGKREHIHSALSAPLIGKHAPVGVLSLNNSTRRSLSLIHI